MTVPPLFVKCEVYIPVLEAVEKCVRHGKEIFSSEADVIDDFANGKQISDRTFNDGGQDASRNISSSLSDSKCLMKFRGKVKNVRSTSAWKKSIFKNY